MNYLKYLERGWNRKEGRGHKDFKKGVKLGQGVHALKRGGGAGTPLGTMYAHLWNTVVTSGMVLRVATWNC